MSIQSAIDELSKQLGTPRERAVFGQWVPYAYLVRGLTERGHGVTTSVKHVLISTGNPVDKRTFGSLRAAYYTIKDKPWPKEGE